jgi:hypothetical protein
MMKAEIISETSDYKAILTLLIFRQYFIAVSCVILINVTAALYLDY